MNVMILDNGEVFTVQTEMRKNKHYQQFYVFWSKVAASVTPVGI